MWEFDDDDDDVDDDDDEDEFRFNGVSTHECYLGQNGIHVLTWFSCERYNKNI